MDFDENLYMTPSADDILEVSPVNTFDVEPSPSHSRVMNDSAFSSSSSEEEDDDDNGEESDNSYDGNNFEEARVNGFRGSKDDNNRTFENEESSTGVSSSDAMGSEFTPSEFDKALSRSKGKPSRGYATSFFAQQLQQHQQQAGESDVEVVANPSMSSATSSYAHNNSIVHVTTNDNKHHSIPLHPQSSYASNNPPPPPQPPTIPKQPIAANIIVTTTNSMSGTASTANTSASGSNTPRHKTPSVATSVRPHPTENQELSSGVLPDVLMTMRQKIESLTLFDSDMMKLADDPEDSDPILVETRESLKRSSQQSISAAVLVSLAHKRYERRRLAAMEIEKVVRSLVQQDELERVRAILLLLSDDYVRSTSEDARKGGVVALAASAIGLKKAHDNNPVAQECRDLILASVVHACQDHSQRVRYYATESLFNVVKVIPALAVQHFFILFEILRSLYADVDLDVRSGAELLDKKLKEVIVGAMNSGSFTADTCVPVFARFVYMRNKATKRLTLTWLQELNEKLIGAPILEFLHLFLGGIFDMVADPTLAIRQSALAFLQSVLPKLLVVNSEAAIDDMESGGMQVDFDKILQSLVTTMEHPDPFVRKVAMYWMSRIVKAHMGGDSPASKRAGKLPPIKTDIIKEGKTKDEADDENKDENDMHALSAATISVRNSLPHVLPGILLSIGDTFHTKTSTKDSFLPDQTTHALADQTNTCLQDAVRRDGKAYVQHLDGFIVALREELDSPGGLNARNPPALERKPYRMDVKHDGTGIESQGWFRSSKDTKVEDVHSMMMSRLCALHWVRVLYESVVPDVLKADYAREFVIPIIHQLVDNPPERIIFKSLEVLAKITVPVDGEGHYSRQWSTSSLSGLTSSPPPWATSASNGEDESLFPMTDFNVAFALDLLVTARRQLKSRDREVFSALIQLHSYNHHLLADLSRVIAFMCRLQPPEFVFVSFAVELERFVRRRSKFEGGAADGANKPFSRDLEFVSSFVQQMCHVLLNAREAKELRDVLKDCIGRKTDCERDRRRARLFHILLHSFSHNLVATTALCLWGGAFRTASLFLRNIDPLDIHLMFLLELDKLIELIERPLFRHLHVRMLECDKEPITEGSGTMLFQTLKSLLMLLPQSTCYNVLRDRLVSTSRFRQSAISLRSTDDGLDLSEETQLFITRVLEVRALHCDAMWQTIREDSLERSTAHAVEGEANQLGQDPPGGKREEGADRRDWLGYSSKEEERTTQARFREETRRRQNAGLQIEEIRPNYNQLDTMKNDTEVKTFLPNKDQEDSWKDYWAQANSNQ